MAVLVIVEKGATRVPAQAVLQQAGLFCYFNKRSVAVVAEERILAVVADEQIVPAIVVIVADTARLAPARTRQPGFDGDVGECSISIVLEEAANGLMALGKSFEPPAVDEKDVEPVVLIVVKECGAAARGFEQVLVAVFAAEDHFHIQPSLFGDVDKLHAERRAGNRRWRALGRRACRRFVRLPGVA